MNPSTCLKKQKQKKDQCGWSKEWTEGRKGCRVWTHRRFFLWNHVFSPPRATHSPHFFPTTVRWSYWLVIAFLFPSVHRHLSLKYSALLSFLFEREEHGIRLVLNSLGSWEWLWASNSLPSSWDFQAWVVVPGFVVLRTMLGHCVCQLSNILTPWALHF